MGGSKGGGTTTQSSTTSIPPEVLARYNSVNAQAQAAAAQPFTPYGGEFVAPVNQTQQGGINNITNSNGTYQPYFDAATSNLNGGLAGSQPYYSTATGQVASGLAAGTAGNANATSSLTGGLGGADIYNTMAGGNYQTAYNGAQPYNGAATGLALAGTQAVNPGALNIGQYMSPYTQSVINSTLGYTDQKQAQDRNALTSNAILSGSYGGDRSGIARGVLQGQQDLARSNIVSGLYNQNYQQALAAGQQQQGVGLGAAQSNRAALQGGANQLLGIGNQGYTQGMGYGSANQGLGQQLYSQGLGASQQYGNIGQQGFSQGLGAANANLGIGGQLFNQGNTAAGTNAGLGTGLLGAQLQQGQAQLGAGTVQQQTGQAQDTAVYNQFLQQQGYPFQVAQFLANIAEGTGALSGSTTTGNTTAPQPFFSDERLKENIKTIGHTKDGLKIIRFNYKGSPHTQIGLSAQDVEKTKPEAVGLAGGFKTVDYDRATRALGGAVANDNAGMGYASGGDTSTLPALLAAHQAMYPGAMNARGIGTGPRGMQLAQPGGRTLMKADLPQIPQQQSSSLKQGMSAASDAKGLYQAGKDLYSGASDIYDWERTKYDTASGLADASGDRSKRAAGGAMPYSGNAGAGYAGGGMAYDPRTLSAILMAHQAMYPGAAGHGAAGGTGAPSIVPTSTATGSTPKMLQGAQLMKLPEAKPTGLKQAMSDVNEGAGAFKTGKSIYTGAKDAVVGTAADPNTKTPASGGLLGTGGKWAPDKGWIGRQTSPSTPSVATPAAGAPTASTSSGSAPTASTSSGSVPTIGPDGKVTTEPLPPVDPVPANDVASAIPVDGSLVDDANSIVARRGGRIRMKRAAGGGMPYGNASYIPEDLYIPLDAARLHRQQNDEVNKLPGDKGGGSSGGGAGGGLGGLGSLFSMGKSGLGSIFGGGGGAADTAGADAAASAAADSTNYASLLADGASAVKRGGRIHRADGGGAQHDNQWMEIPGQVIGTGVGMFYGGPIGGMAGGKAGKNAGATIGDIVGGNWNGAGQDMMSGITDGLKPALQGLGGGGLPGMYRGGRARRADGGALPYGNHTYLPEDSLKSLDPAELKNEQGKINGPAGGTTSGGGGGGGSGGGDMLGTAMKLAPLAMMFLKRGGAVDDNVTDFPQRHADVLRRARHAIGTIESGNRYDIVGPATKNDRPYGRYQVMGNNVGPWTREALGQELTPQQFLADPKAQDAVFDHHFGKAMRQHGTPQDAASVWFSGRPLNSGNMGDKDVLGTSVPDYIKKFDAHMGYDGSDIVDHAQRIAAAAPADDELDRTAKNLNSLGLGAATGGRIGKDVGGPAIGDDPNMPNIDPLTGQPRERIEHHALPALGAANIANTPAPQATSQQPPTQPFNVQTGSSGQVPSTPAASTPAASTPAASKDEPGWFDKGGWMDRNEKPVATGLSFLGNMLASPSHQLLGSIGSGLAAAAPTWASYGFKQKGIDIQQQQADTQRVNSVQNAMNLVSLQKANALRADPTIDTSSYDASLAALYQQQQLGLGIKNPGTLPRPTSYDQILKTLPASAQELAGKLQNQDNPWFLQHLASTTTDRAQADDYQRQANEARERVRMGQGIAKDGVTPVPVTALTEAALDLGRRKASAESTGSQQTPKSELEITTAAIKQFEAAHPGLTANTKGHLSSHDRDVYDQLLRNQEVARGKITPLPSQRAAGGRVGFADGGTPFGGAPATEPPPGIDDPADWVAQEPKKLSLPTADETNSPEFWRARAQHLGASGLIDEANKANETAANLYGEQRKTGIKTTDNGIANVPGYTEAEAAKTRASTMAAVPAQAELAQVGLATDAIKAHRAKAAAAQGQLQYLQPMTHAFRSLEEPSFVSMGPYSEERANVGRMLNTVSRTFGGGDIVDPTKIASVEEMLKDSTRLGQAYSQGAMGPNQPGMIIQQSVGATPGNKNSSLGYARLSAGLEQMVDYQMKKTAFLEKWAQDHGGTLKPDAQLGDVENAFARAEPVQKYVDRALVSSVNPPHAEALRHNVQNDPEHARAYIDSFDKKYGKGVGTLVIGH